MPLGAGVIPFSDPAHPVVTSGYSIIANHVNYMSITFIYSYRFYLVMQPSNGLPHVAMPLSSKYYGYHLLAEVSRYGYPRLIFVTSIRDNSPYTANATPALIYTSTLSDR